VSSRQLAAFLAVLAVLGLLGYGLISKGEASISVGQPAPDRQLSRLDGKGAGRIADYRGQWVLVNFWASWCEPCRTESPALQRFYDAHRRGGFTVLGIDSRDLTPDGLAFVKRYHLTYPQLRDGDGKRSDAFGMSGFPESFLVNPQGKLALIRRGPVDRKFLDSYVAPLIAKQ
jgi:peroxiredoxin